ncbi:MAG: hypothetical protein P4L50_10595 [Anaerolineaceae bacterium]|nr:hypothetical protein [Anaerolineaceae bacterium]
MSENTNSFRFACNAIYSDYRRYRATGNDHPLRVIFFTQGFWASTTFRINHFLRSINLPLLKQFVRIYIIFSEKWIEILTGICLPSTCEIGKGLFIGHFGHIILSTEARLGCNCNISPGVTIGLKQRGDRKGVPQIGDRVYIGTNAVLIGNITIGDDVAVGAGAIVTRSAPAGAVVAGNPARIISYQGSYEMVTYDGRPSSQPVHPLKSEVDSF